MRRGEADDHLEELFLDPVNDAAFDVRLAAIETQFGRKASPQDRWDLTLQMLNELQEKKKNSGGAAQA